MIDTPADIINLGDQAEAIEDLGIAITTEIRGWMDNQADPRSDGQVAVDYILNPGNVQIVAPVLIAAGWRPPAYATATATAAPLG